MISANVCAIVTVSSAVPRHVVKDERIASHVMLSLKIWHFYFVSSLFSRVSNRVEGKLGCLMLPQTLPKNDAAFIFTHITFLAFRMVSSFILLHVRKHN